MIDVHVEYVTYQCTMYGGNYFPEECEYPEDNSGCPEYNDRVLGKEMVIYCICTWASRREHVIHKSVKTLEYDEGEGIKIGRKWIPWYRILHLVIDGETKVSKQ